MNAKTLSIRIVFAMTVLLTLSGIWQPASARSGVFRLQEGQTIGLGGQGLHATNIPLGVSEVYLDNVGRNLPARFTHKMDLQISAPALEVRFLDAKGGEVERISAIVYVYFNIRRAEREQWFNSGMDEIAIWFASSETGLWELCPTYFVHQSGADGTVGRLACLARGSGYYVLAEGDFSEYAPKPVTLQPPAAAK